MESYTDPLLASFAVASLTAHRNSRSQWPEPPPAKAAILRSEGPSAGYFPAFAEILLDLKRATDDFRRVISSHPQGTIYEARFSDDSCGMVKEVAGEEQTKDDFYREVQLLGCLHHRHVVPLKGYSIGRKSFLIFEGTGQGSLKQHLNDPLRSPLNWRTRLQIAVGVAAALEYLYFFCDPPVYSISISSSDILLDENLTAKLSSINIVSTPCSVNLPSSNSEGSLQPDRRLIPKFGSLLLELITGQSSEKGSGDVVEWVQESHFNVSMHKMIDPDLGNSYDSKTLRNLLNVARLCTKAGEKPSFSMSHVLWYLQAKVGISPDS